MNFYALIASINFVAWSLSLACFYFIWPYIRHSRRWTVTMAALCLTPFLAYPGISLPLVVTIPIYMAMLALPTPWQMGKVLPAGIAIGVMAWLLYNRFLAEAKR